MYGSKNQSDAVDTFYDQKHKKDIETTNKLMRSYVVAIVLDTHLWIRLRFASIVLTMTTWLVSSHYCGLQMIQWTLRTTINIPSIIPQMP